MLSFNSHFQCAFTACVCIFEVISLVGSDQCYYFENATEYSKRTLKTTFTIQLKFVFLRLNFFYRIPSWSSRPLYLALVYFSDPWEIFLALWQYFKILLFLLIRLT